MYQAILFLPLVGALFAATLGRLAGAAGQRAIRLRASPRLRRATP